MSLQITSLQNGAPAHNSNIDDNTIVPAGLTQAYNLTFKDNRPSIIKNLLDDHISISNNIAVFMFFNLPYFQLFFFLLNKVVHNQLHTYNWV